MSTILRTAVTDYLNAVDKAAQWVDARFTDDANRSERKRLTEPAKATLQDRIDGSVGRATADRAAYTDAVASALHDDSDNNRVLARELAWQRIVRRAERGELLTAIARDASPVELEAIAGFAPAEMPHLDPNGVSRTPQEWRSYVEEIVGEVYPTHPANAQRFDALREQADAAEETLALADLGTALIDGRPIDGQLANRVYNVDPELYRRAVTGVAV